MTGRRLALVTGVGPGTGAAIARRFATGGYDVAMLARNGERLAALAREIPNTHAYVCDVTDETQLDATVAALRGAFGEPSVLVHNAVGGARGNFLEIDPQVLNRNFQVNTMALLYLARRLAPAMVAAGSGAIIATGNTSAHRGRAGFAGFAPTKAAQRVLAEAIAREIGPKGGPCRLCHDRRRYRPRLDARALAGRAGRLLHQACRHRGGDMARRPPGSQRMVVQRRIAAIPGNMVSTSRASKRKLPGGQRWMTKRRASSAGTATCSVNLV
jgi:nucleoside-diphosphate-sugar epimerase